MRGKCATCEFYVAKTPVVNQLNTGTCHIRSVDSDEWPQRVHDDECGEWSSLAAALEREAHLQRDPPGPLDDEGHCDNGHLPRILNGADGNWRVECQRCDYVSMLPRNPDAEKSLERVEEPS